jgi:predicted nucleotidyltransferase
MEYKINSINIVELFEAYRRILYYFFSFPNSYIGLNDLSESVNMSKTATKTSVISLSKQGLLKVDQIGKAWRISVKNAKDNLFTKSKISYNLQLVYGSGIVQAVYNKFSNVKSVILFGSYRWGTDIEDSDIDIAIEINGKENLKIEKLGKISKLGYRKNVPVNLHIFSRDNIDRNLFSNIANGILLDGFLEVNK